MGKTFPTRLLAIDPGDTTGVVLIEGPLPSDLLWSGRTHNYDPGPIFGLLDEPDFGHLIRTVVIEQPPEAGHSTRLVALFGALKAKASEHGADVVTMLPSEWKPIARRLRMRGPVVPGWTRHERDAYCMAWVYLRRSQT